MTSQPDEYLVDRTVVIRARRPTVFRYFTDSVRFAAWWGQGSEIEGRVGGKVHIRYPNTVTAGGEVTELIPDRRIVFSYGYDDPGKQPGRGGSLVTITLEDHPEGTLLRLVHRLADPANRDAHDPGWRFQLSLFANLVAREFEAGLPGRLDDFLALWSEADGVARARGLEALVTEDVVFRDAFAAVQGREELSGHIAATQVHLPGARLIREGTPLQVQGAVLWDWTARSPDGTVRGRGTNVVELDPEGRIAKVVGFWRP